MKRLARAILDAQKIREESYDQKASDKLLHSNSFIKDFDSCYTVSEEEAADKAAKNAGYDERTSFPIYLLIKYCGNDIQDWANAVLQPVQVDTEKRDNCLQAEK